MTLLRPLPGRVDAQRVFVLEVSRHGIRVAHRESFGGPGERRLIHFDWNGRSVAVEGRLMHSQAQRIGQAAYARSLYHSGFAITAIEPRCDAVLRELITWHVERALHEQKANARGVPPRPTAPQPKTQPGTLVRHALVAGTWSAADTTERRQPPDGFTISAAQTSAEVDMLRSAWETGDASTRAVIQRLAALSIEPGVPVARRYTP